MTDVEAILADAICALGIRREVQLNTGETLTVTIVDRPWLAEPTTEAQAKKNIWSTVYALKSLVAAPETVHTLTETVSGKFHKVQSLQPTTQVAFVAWDCISQR